METVEIIGPLAENHMSPAETKAAVRREMELFIAINSLLLLHTHTHTHIRAYTCILNRIYLYICLYLVL